jgi:Arc/MetJ-type ribon-helix-helix transcriptional regulator
MPLTLKLDEQLERELRQYVLSSGETTSHVVREAIREYLVKVERPSAYELGKDLFGALPADAAAEPEMLAHLAEKRRQVLADYWEERHARRQAIPPR